MSESTSPYLHGTAPEEQQRLTALNDLLNRATLRELALAGGERILDVGSGLGQLSRSMARAAGPNGRVVGIERSREQIAEARHQARVAGEHDLVEFRAGDAMHLDLPENEWGTYDLAHTRFVLEHVADPLAVVRGMVRAVRPGGRVVLADDDHEVARLWPEPEGFTELWNAYCLAFESTGYDPIIGRRLVELLHQAGAQPRRNHWIWFGGCSGDPMFPALIANLIGVIVSLRKTMLSKGLTDARTFDATIDAIRRFGERPDAAIWFSMCWAEGVRPG